jgi:hypothetical protein
MPFSHHAGLSSALRGKGLRLNKITNFASAILRPGPPKAARELKILRRDLFIYVLPYCAIPPTNAGGL